MNILFDNEFPVSDLPCIKPVAGDLPPTTRTATNGLPCHQFASDSILYAKLALNNRLPYPISGMKTTERDVWFRRAYVIGVTVTAFIILIVTCYSLVTNVCYKATNINTNGTSRNIGHCYSRYGFIPLKSNVTETHISTEVFYNLKTIHDVFTFPAKSQTLISQLQTAQMKVMRPLLRRYKYAMLFGLYTDENKGDPAIGLGEIMFLRQLNIEVVYHCEQSKCRDSLDTALEISKKYSKKKLAIFLQGGGDMAQWHNKDSARARVIKYFPSHQIFLFPQSIYLRPSTDNMYNVEFCKRVYNSHPRLTLLYRDTPSLYKSRALFPRARSFLLPDMAFQIGSVERTMAPTHDIVWLKRKDHETPDVTVPSVSGGLRMSVSDWLNWKTHIGDVMENQFLMTHSGFTFLQRGRVVITDRLHGHVMCILLDIPHVIIDSKTGKIGNHYNTWAQGLDNVMVAKSGAEAVTMAVQLLRMLDKTLPKVAGYFNSTEEFTFSQFVSLQKHSNSNTLKILPSKH